MIRLDGLSNILLCCIHKSDFHYIKSLMVNSINLTSNKKDRLSSFLRCLYILCENKDIKSENTINTPFFYNYKTYDELTNSFLISDYNFFTLQKLVLVNEKELDFSKFKNLEEFIKFVKENNNNISLKIFDSESLYNEDDNEIMCFSLKQDVESNFKILKDEDEILNETKDIISSFMRTIDLFLSLKEKNKIPNLNLINNAYEEVFE